MDLAGFIDAYRDAIAQRVVESYPPRYRPSDPGRPLPPLLRTPLGAQADAIRGAALSRKAQRGTTVVGEMGTGQALVDLVAAERLAGRRVLVYATHTGTRDITGRMEDFLGRHGFRVAVMKADAVPPERREAWVAQRVEEGVDVLVCHPRLVQTGLDLVDFPTICWYETDYSVYTMRQASRRSWRIGQTEPVQVVFMAYRNTLQADALKLVAKKLQSSLAVEGELPEDGLAAYGDDGDDLMLALARKIVAGEEDADSVESVFTQAQQVAAEAEALLVDGEWAAPEPVAAETVTVGADADHRRDDAPERQCSLFSWAEFMAGEREQPKRQTRRPEPASISLFEWALEREREGEVVGAKRLGRSTQGEATAHAAVASPSPADVCGVFCVHPGPAGKGAWPRAWVDGSARTQVSSLACKTDGRSSLTTQAG